MAKTKKSWPIISILFLFVALILIAFDWKSCFKSDSMTISGNLKQVSLEKSETIPETVLTKNYVLGQGTFLEGEIVTENNYYFFGNLNKIINDDSLLPTQIEEILQFTNSPVKITADGKFIGFFWSRKHGLVSVSKDEIGTQSTGSVQLDSDYGLYLKDGFLKGNAWGDKIGWICFGDCAVEKDKAEVKAIETNYFYAKPISIIFSVRYFLAGILAVIAVCWAFLKLQRK